MNLFVAYICVAMSHILKYFSVMIYVTRVRMRRLKSPNRFKKEKKSESVDVYYAGFPQRVYVDWLQATRYSGPR